MQEVLYEYYLWVKAVHIFAAISWMAGMLYLPRLFVYHVDAAKNGELDETLQVMERRLLRIIMNPAMIVTWLAGIALMWANPSIMTSGGWIHVKLSAVLILSALHGLLARHRKQFLNGTNAHSAKYYRIFNEVPAFLLIVIVIMVVIRPF